MRGRLASRPEYDARPGAEERVVKRLQDVIAMRDSPAVHFYRFVRRLAGNLLMEIKDILMLGRFMNRPEMERTNCRGGSRTALKPMEDF